MTPCSTFIVLLYWCIFEYFMYFLCFLLTVIIKLEQSYPSVDRSSGAEPHSFKRTFLCGSRSIWKLHLVCSSHSLAPSTPPKESTKTRTDRACRRFCRTEQENTVQPTSHCQRQAELKPEGEHTWLASSSATWSRHGSHPKCLMRTRRSFWFWPRNWPRVTLLKNTLFWILTQKRLWWRLNKRQKQQNKHLQNFKEPLWWTHSALRASVNTESAPILSAAFDPDSSLSVHCRSSSTLWRNASQSLCRRPRRRV